MKIGGMAERILIPFSRAINYDIFQTTPMKIEEVERSLVQSVSLNLSKQIFVAIRSNKLSWLCLRSAV